MLYSYTVYLSHQNEIPELIPEIIRGAIDER